MVKRKGYIIEKVADMDNLRNAAREAQRNKNPRNDSIVAFNANPEPKLQALREMILTLHFPETQYRHKELQNDYGKVRSLCYEDYYPWNVLQYAIMRVIGRDVFSGIVYDSFSCVPGKGTHWGVRRLKMFLRRYPEFKWRVQCDGRKYYFSLPHYIILQRFSRKYKDKKFLKLLEVAVLKFESGPEYMKIFEDEIEKRDKRSKHRGYMSQALSLLASNPIARHMKEHVRVKCLLLQCDDCLMLAATKGDAWKYFNEYDAQCAANGIVIKSSYTVAPIAHLLGNNEKEKDGARGRGEEVGERFEFLGYRFSRERNLMRKMTKKRFVRKTRAKTSAERHRQILASYWGICKHGHCRHLWNVVTNNNMSFAEKGIKKRDRIKDGQKFFEVEERKLFDLVNLPMTIVDFQKDISTRLGAGRYCVLCEIDGRRFKFITNSINIKDVLDQAAEAEEKGNDIFPVTNVIIRRKSIGDGKSMYYFDE